MSIIRVALGMVAVATAMYAFFLLSLFFLQGLFIFPAPPKNYLLYESVKDFSADLSSAGKLLQGWKVSGAQEKSDVVAIYFGGNGEDIAGSLRGLEKIPVSTVYAYNYRGYGLSTGVPDESALYEDSLFIISTIKQQNPDKRIAIIGASLGSAIAGYAATKTQPSLLVLLVPLHSVEKIIQETLRNLIPGFVIKNKFNLAEHAKNINTKTLMVCAGEDRVISNADSQVTYENISSSKKIAIIEEAGHNDLFAYDQTFDLLTDFFGKQ